jgi:hypothetical protein
MGDYHSIFNDEYKLDYFEEFFTKRYVADSYVVPDDMYTEIYWGRVACELFVVYVVFSVLAFEPPENPFIFFTYWSVHVSNIALFFSGYAARYPNSKYVTWKT